MYLLIVIMNLLEVIKILNVSSIFEILGNYFLSFSQWKNLCLFQLIICSFFKFGYPQVYLGGQINNTRGLLIIIVINTIAK
jgi:hypothetical protein